MNRLAGKRALITGGTSGIGLETARQFLREGARVMVTGTNTKNLEAASTELGPNVEVIASDASNVAAQKVLADAVRQKLGALDILFVNAGIVDMRPVDQIDEAAFDRSFAINLKDSGPPAAIRKPCLDRIQWLGECAHWDAEHQCVRGLQSRIAFPGQNAFR